MPLEDSGIVTLFARVWPAGKLIDEVGGVLVGVTVIGDEARGGLTGDRDVAGHGDGVGRDARDRRPTGQVRALFGVNMPLRPDRRIACSSTRTGAIGTYVAPAVWSGVTLVSQSAPPEYSLAFHAWFGTCGSWAMPT